MRILDNLRWHGHASFSLRSEHGDKLSFIDPLELKAARKADVIFITHAHFDHCSPDDIRKLLAADTLVVAASGCVDKLGLKSVRITEPGETFNALGMNVSTVAAYNTKPERLSFHPKRNGWVGYVIETGGERLYHAGDTDFVPEMKSLGKVDVALLPIGGTYTMDADEALEAANVIKAKTTVPMHYRRLLGERSAEAEETFRRGVKGEVIVMDEVS